MRLNWFISVSLLVAFLVPFCSIGQMPQKTNEKPNILLIITDQQTSSAMSCTGNRYIKTPAMDRLAESGIRFNQCYVTQPLCLPFRSSLQTGRYPHEIGTISNGLEIKGDFPMLGNLMADAGYHCKYIGKWHVGAEPGDIGYSDFDSSGKDPEKTIKASNFLKKKHDQPFFLTVSLMNPHNVCQLARGQDLPDGAIGEPPMYTSLLPPLPDNFAKPENEPTVIREIQAISLTHYPTADWSELEWRQYLWGYYKLVEKVDTQIGTILDALKEGGHLDNTVVIFTSDHGEGVAMHHWNQKQILYDQSVRVPFIINWNGVTEKSLHSGLVSNALDIPVTILELAGVEAPSSMHGKSMVPLLTGGSVESRDYVITETTFARGTRNLGATGRMIRTSKYKYCIYDNGDSREQLFDMEADPGEMVNLAVDEKYHKELNRHRKLITNWAKATGDTNFPYQLPL